MTSINLCVSSLRWRILKTGIRLHSLEVVDDIWRTCCALHNFLLEEDGLNSTWESGLNASDYLGELGQHDGVDAGRHVPLVFARANDPRTYDISGMGTGRDETFDKDLSSTWR